MALLTNDVVRLRALEPEDLERLYAWENDASLWAVGNTLSPFSRYVLKDYIAHSDPDIYLSRQLRLMVEMAGSSEVVGMVDLYDFDPHASRAAVGVLVDPAYAGRGLASEAVRLLMAYAFSHLHIHQLYAYVPVLNEPSLRLFRRLGFSEAGRLVDWARTPSGYSDVILFQAFPFHAP